MSMKDTIGSLDALQTTDPEVYAAIDAEEERQRNKLLLIASENFASPAVLAAQGSVMTNKYAEGYPGKRYYGGCQHVDTVEDLAIQRCKQIFGAEHVNVQPHSGSQANMAAYLSVLKPGDTILGMDLAQGGHLTHGSKVNFSGIIFRAFSYGVDRQTETINYDAVQKLAEECRPRMIVVGASAYARTLDFPEFQADRQIGRRLSDGGYCPHRGADRGRLASESCSLCRLCDNHDTQDPSRAARRRRDVQGRACQGRRQVRIPGHARRPSDACDRRKSRRLQGGALTGVSSGISSK